MGAPPLSPFGITKYAGLGKVNVRSGDTSRPQSRGSYVGVNLLDVRKPTFTIDVAPPWGSSYTSLSDALGALRTAFSTEGNTEYPLWIQMPGFPFVCCMARVIGWDPQYDVATDIASLIKGAALQFVCDDPYFYKAPTQTTTLTLPVPGVGFSFPITFPMSFGGASGGNVAVINNAGDVPCYPTLVINGPCLNPSVQNSSIAGGPTLTFNIELYSGDKLVVDCDLQSILYYTSGSSVGAEYPQILESGSEFFVLAPGDNSVSFNSQDTSQASGTLDVWNTSVYSELL